MSWWWALAVVVPAWAVCAWATGPTGRPARALTVVLGGPGAVPLWVRVLAVETAIVTAIAVLTGRVVLPWTLA